MKVTFRQKSGMHYLFADISVSSIRIQTALGISIKQGKFVEKIQGVQGESDIETNILLNNYKSEILALIRTLQINGKLSKDAIRDGVKLIRERLINADFTPVEDKSFTMYIQNFIDRNSGIRKPATLKQYNNSLAKLKAYENKMKVKLTFDNIDYVFYNAFLTYCIKDLKLSSNSIGNIIKGIKLWMNSAHEEGLHTNVVYSTRSFKKPAESSENIYLSESELKTLKTTIMPNKHLEHVRDFFLLACYTGVRSQDYSKLNKSNLINDGKMFKVRTEKTNEEVIIPIHPEAKRILEKYNGTPKTISNQKFNEYIKIVCEIAGLNEMITLSMTVAGKRVSTTKPKHKCVSSHTARRSFATNAYKAGVPSLAIMAITGHRTEKVFLHYIKVTKEEHAMLSSEHPFFAIRTA